MTLDPFVVPDVTTYDHLGNGFPNLGKSSTLGTRRWDPQGNPDLDQYSNLEEWTNGTDPNRHDGGTDFRLIGRWQFNEQSGTTFHDDSSAARDGSLNGNVQWRTDPGERKYVEFADNQAGASIPASDLILGENDADFTVAFWFKLLGQNTGNWREFIRKSNNDYQRTFALWLWPHSSQIHARISGAVDWDLGIWDSNSHLALSESSRVAYVKRGNRLELYVNGSLDKSEVLSEPIIGIDGPITIGESLYQGVHAGYGHLAIYDAALSAQDIASLQIVANTDPITTVSPTSRSWSSEPTATTPIPITTATRMAPTPTLSIKVSLLPSALVTGV